MNAPSFVLEPSRCTGCDACRVACAIENRMATGQAWRTVHHANPEHHPALPVFHLSLACNHCERPACLEGCPADAYRRDPATGAVLIDEARCMGCRYCTWMCPYGAPKYDEARGVVSKCTFCQPRLLEGRTPACAAACPTGALGIEARAPLSEPAFPGLPQRGLGPALRILGKPSPAPETAPPAEARPMLPEAPAGRAVAKEWSLVLFTSLILLLLALQVLWFRRGLRPLGGGLFLLIALLAGASSLLHLGRPERAWRALANLGSSWLSREILAFSLFVAGSATAQLLSLQGSAGGFALVLGAILLVCVDRVYQAAEGRPWWRPRSAELLPAGLQVGAIAGGFPALVLTLALLRTVLLLAEKDRDPRLLEVLRLLGLLLPAAAMLLRPDADPAWLLLPALLGEGAGRAAFYGALDLGDPARILAGQAFRGARPAPEDPA